MKSYANRKYGSSVYTLQKQHQQRRMAKTPAFEDKASPQFLAAIRVAEQFAAPRVNPDLYERIMVSYSRHSRAAMYEFMYGGWRG